MKKRAAGRKKIVQLPAEGGGEKAAGLLRLRNEDVGLPPQNFTEGEFAGLGQIQQFRSEVEVRRMQEALFGLAGGREEGLEVVEDALDAVGEVAVHTLHQLDLEATGQITLGHDVEEVDFGGQVFLHGEGLVEAAFADGVGQEGAQGGKDFPCVIGGAGEVGVRQKCVDDSLGIDGF